MLKAYFVKITDNITLKQIEEKTYLQKIGSNKPLHYNSIVDLEINSKEYADLINSISKPNHHYLSYSSQSIADKNGVWNCITIKCNDERDVILYTAGRTFPLYAAIKSI